ncbi:MAG: hypothetical protein Q9216_003624 [Gyalolechia sp. 2 TL-2023]
MDVLTRPFRSAPSPHVPRGQETSSSDDMRSPLTDKQLHDIVGSTTPPRRIHLAQLLREAHTEQKRNTRSLEESYHALRKSTRLLEQRWGSYCNELERELNASSWRSAPRAPVALSERVERPRPDRSRNAVNSMEKNADVATVESPKELHEWDFPQARRGYQFPEMSYPERYDWHAPTGEPTGSRPGRSRSNTIQHPGIQRPPVCSSSPKAGDLSIGVHTLPLLPAESPSSHEVRVPLGLPGSGTPPSQTSKAPAWHASLPTREQLVELSEHSRPRFRPARPPVINLIPPTPPQSPQSTMESQEILPPVRIADFNSPIYQSSQSYSPYESQQASINGMVNFSLPHAQMRTTKKQEPAMVDKNSKHQSEMEVQLVHQDTQDALKEPRPQRRSRAKLHKRRNDVGWAL